MGLLSITQVKTKLITVLTFFINCYLYLLFIFVIYIVKYIGDRRHPIEGNQKTISKETSLYVLLFPDMLTLIFIFNHILWAFYPGVRLLADQN